MCHTVNVSYAVINQSDISDFSPALELTIYGGMCVCVGGGGGGGGLEWFVSKKF